MGVTKNGKRLLPCQKKNNEFFPYCWDHLKECVGLEKKENAPGFYGPTPILITNGPRKQGDTLSEYIGSIKDFPAWVDWNPVEFRFHNSGKDNVPQKTFKCALKEARCTFFDESPCDRRVVFTHPYCTDHLRDKFQIEIKKSTIKGAGLGLFVCENESFENDQVVAYYIGDMTSKDELDQKYGEFTAPYAFSLGLIGAEGEEMVIDAACVRGPAAYINHAEAGQANSAFFIQPHDKRTNGPVLYVKALRSIRAEEEIFASYGQDYKFNEGSTVSTRVVRTAQPRFVVSPRDADEELMDLEKANATIIRADDNRFYLKALDDLKANSRLRITYTQTELKQRFLYHASNQFLWKLQQTTKTVPAETLVLSEDHKETKERLYSSLASFNGNTIYYTNQFFNPLAVPATGEDWNIYSGLPILESPEQRTLPQDSTHRIAAQDDRVVLIRRYQGAEWGATIFSNGIWGYAYLELQTASMIRGVALFDDYLIYSTERRELVCVHIDQQRPTTNNTFPWKMGELAIDGDFLFVSCESENKVFKFKINHHEQNAEAKGNALTFSIEHEFDVYKPGGITTQNGFVFVVSDTNQIVMINSSSHGQQNTLFIITYLPQGARIGSLCVSLDDGVVWAADLYLPRIYHFSILERDRIP